MLIRMMRKPRSSRPSAPASGLRGRSPKRQRQAACEKGARAVAQPERPLVVQPVSETQQGAETQPVLQLACQPGQGAETQPELHLVAEPEHGQPVLEPQQGAETQPELQLCP